MSTFVVRLLTCDGVIDGEVCPAEFGGDSAIPTLAALLQAANRAGWRRVGPTRRDLCPDCRKGGTS